MATHSSILAWRIPGTEETGGLQPLGSHSVGHDRATNTSTFTFCKLKSPGIDFMFDLKNTLIWDPNNVILTQFLCR